MTMTPREAISYIENYSWSTTRLGLGRTKELLSLLGDPQKKLKFIHVAGSNGKGSTSAMLASILKEAGNRTGLYISPYIQEFGERIQINGENIQGERLAEITERVKALADEMEDHPSQFELVTAIAMEYYFEERCDIVVLEVGMGGALDSTNAIDAPEVAVITNIGLEHTEYLGSTLSEIAETKAGIIKTGSSAVLYDGSKEAVDVIKRICIERNVPLRIADFSDIKPLDFNLKGQSFAYKGKEFFLPLLGPHQLKNAALALETIEVLKKRGWNIADDEVKRGMEKVIWPARFEVLTQEPLFILDGGHNPQCAEALKETIDIYLPDDKIVFLLGVLADKDYESIISLMEDKADRFICVTPNSERALPAKDLAQVIEGRGGRAIYADSISEGISLALDSASLVSDSVSLAPDRAKGKPVIAFGSLYLAGAVRTEFHKELKAWMRREGKNGRRNLPLTQWIDNSNAISERILSLKEYEEAETIFIYKSAKGEVSLDLLERRAKEDGKTICFPRWGEQDMEAVRISETPPHGSGEKAGERDNPGNAGECDNPGNAWERGNPGNVWERGNPGNVWERGDAPWGEASQLKTANFWQPTEEAFDIVNPEDIDLVICPLVGFDEECFRLGMGGGYYDRFLPKCINARKIGVAFEVQKFSRVPRDTWDIPLDKIVTEKGIYRR